MRASDAADGFAYHTGDMMKWTTSGRTDRGWQHPVPPPIFRTLILISVALIVVALGYIAASERYSAAQITPVDYDTDNDGLIEVSSVNQWRSISDDLDGDGIVSSTSAYWNTTGYPNAATAAGCPPRDHDGNSATPDVASCIGYELVADLSIGSHRITGTYTAKLVGNGFRLMNPTGNADFWAPVRTLDWNATIEGIGVINPTLTASSNRRNGGGLVSDLRGNVFGVYVQGGTLGGGRVGGIAAIAHNDPSSGRSMIAHSYVRGTTLGDNNRVRVGGLAGEWASHNSNGPTCVNSYFSGTVNHTGDRGGLIGGWLRWNRGTFNNCFGDRTTDTNTAVFGYGSTSGTSRTKAEIISPTGYTGPFANWDDYAANGNSLASSAPRTDFWDFGDDTTFPVLKAWGHDISMASTRDLTGTDTVNLCTRTLAVANEIIRLLKDDTFADGVTGPVPAVVTSLTECTASTDTQSVSINNLRDYAATTPANPLSLNPDRTSPPSPKLTAIKRSDFAYLVNAKHIDLSSNALTSVPPRLFQGVQLRWISLAHNDLVSLPADLFAGIASIPINANDGNAIHLNGNQLTDTGIPGRLFDSMQHINGIDLRDNALTRINTRWFERLGLLGTKPSSTTAPVSFLGLGMTGNTVTDHYYSNKIFTGVLKNRVAYTGASAGGDLKTAIVAAIIAWSGEDSAPATLDLISTDYYINDGPNAGYQASGTTCPATATVGPLGDAYHPGQFPECYILPHWTAPQQAGATTAPTTPTGIFTIQADQLFAIFNHLANSNFRRFEIRYRQTPTDPQEPWTQDWRAIAISSAAGTKSVTIDGIATGTEYQVQLRVVTTSGLSNALGSMVGGPAPPEPPTPVEPETPTTPEPETPATPGPEATATPEPEPEPEPEIPSFDLGPPENFNVVEETGTLVMSWDAPTIFTPTRYEYRTQRTGTTDWSDWTSIEHRGALGSRQSHRLTDLTAGTSLRIQLRYVVVVLVSPAATASASIRINIPEINSIKPVVRWLVATAGETVTLYVDVYNAQDVLQNSLADADDSQVVFQWRQADSSSSRGSFGEPAHRRRVSYTVPELPGRYIVTAEAGPDGICRSHHNGDPEITAEDRAPCIATFTVHVTNKPSEASSRPDPTNPPGVIPTSLTDNEGIAYTVFTPAAGGTFTGESVTVSAPAGAVPDRSLLGISASASGVPTPAPVPGASMTIAGRYHDINAITQAGTAPLTSYTLNSPLEACLPYPDEFRADLSNVVMVQRAPAGELTILSTKVRTNAGILTVCGAVSTLPATVAVAKLGTVPAAPPTPAPEQELPEAGGAAPSAGALVATLLAGLLVLAAIAPHTAIRRIGRTKRPIISQS